METNKTIEPSEEVNEIVERNTYREIINKYRMNIAERDNEKLNRKKKRNRLKNRLAAKARKKNIVKK